MGPRFPLAEWAAPSPSQAQASVVAVVVAAAAVVVVVVLVAFVVVASAAVRSHLATNVHLSLLDSLGPGVLTKQACQLTEPRLV